RNELGGGAGNAYANIYDRRADRGLSGNHISHRLIWGAVYEMPYGRGRWIDLPNRALQQAMGGWTFGYIAELHTGPSYGVTEQTNRTNAFSPAQRPNVAGAPKISGSRSRAEKINAWFNTAAFAQPAQFTFGNAGRINGYGPVSIAMDLSILKDFRITEQA